MNRRMFTDQDLIEGYLAGKESNLNELIRRHEKKVYGYIFLKVRDRDVANDLFQDSFVKAINHIKDGAYNEQGKFIQWIMRIAHNVVIDYFRAEQQMVRSTDEYNVFDTINLFDENCEDLMIKEQIDVKIRQLINLLPENQKEVVLMRHYDDMSFNEIAETTGVSINTALGRMRYALINLRKLIESHQIQLTQ